MPERTVPGTDLHYFLTVFDEDGRERTDGGGLLSDTVLARLSGAGHPPVTDIFLASHGWLGDIPGAVQQYDRWFATMLTLRHDRNAAETRPQGFRPLVVGLHWPSLPFGDERLDGSGEGGLLSETNADRPSAMVSESDLVDAYAARIADTPAARRALAVVIAAARTARGEAPSAEVQEAYRTLFAESGLGSDGATGAPGSDQDGFEPERIIVAAREATPTPAPGVTGTPGVLGFGDRITDLLLAPLRQLSFWRMKDRARRFGESGAHGLVRRLQVAAPGARVHLMGHSFGCIVASAAVVGGVGTLPLPRPVDSLFLVQGALSLWSAGTRIPFPPRGSRGYFHRLVTDRLVRGPIVATHSANDFAVGRFYPLGARVAQQMLLDGEKLPAYGAVGAFGLQGLDPAAQDTSVQNITFAYGLIRGSVWNVDATRVIDELDGPGGAHNDISHPEIAHLQWQAVLAP